MERSEELTHESDCILGYRSGLANGREEVERKINDKARYDRFVCAVISGAFASPHFNCNTTSVVNDAMNLMLAADKRWEEYMKGGEDV